MSKNSVGGNLIGLALRVLLVGISGAISAGFTNRCWRYFSRISNLARHLYNVARSRVQEGTVAKTLQ